MEVLVDRETFPSEYTKAIPSVGMILCRNG